MARSVSFVLPNYNGRDLLARYLPSIVAAAQEYPDQTEVVMVDDGSQDGSAEWVEETYPDVRVVRFARNRGALPAKNECFRQARYPIVICLNNDVELQPGFAAPLVRHFDDPTVFGVSAQVLLAPEGLADESVSYPAFERGSFQVIQPGLNGAPLPTKATPILFPHGGACAYDRAKLLALGGYDPLYYPIYWDDLDVGYGAWKRGWRVLWEPAAVAHHEHQGTMRRVLEQRNLSRLMARNLLLFTWKHVHDTPWLAAHLAFLAARLAWQAARGRSDLASVLVAAGTRLPLVWRSRRREQALAVRRDREVLDLLLAARQAAVG